MLPTKIKILCLIPKNFLNFVVNDEGNKNIQYLLYECLHTIINPCGSLEYEILFHNSVSLTFLITQGSYRKMAY